MNTLKNETQMKKILSSILLSLLLGSFANAQINLSGGLVAHYSFQNASLNDVSGNNNHFLTAPNSTHSTDTDPWGNSNGAIRLAPSKMPELPLSTIQSFPLGANARTISVWFKLDSMPAAGPTNLNFIFYYGTKSFGNAIGLAVGNNELVGIGYLDDLNASVSITPNTWHHALLTFGNAFAQLYLDGSSVVGGFKIWNTFQGNGSLGFFDFVSSTPQGGNLPTITYRNVFRGVLDELRIYNRVLNAAEISALSSTTPVGLKDAITFNEIELFPNPATTVLNLKGEALRKAHLIELYSSTGHLVKQLRILEGKLNQSISLEGLPEGIYLLKVNNHPIKHKILNIN